MHSVNPLALARRQLAIEELQQAGWLAEVTWVDEIDSTNSWARRRLLADDLPLPALLVADRQTAGRGRTTHSWWSPAGCLMMSLTVDSQQLPSSPVSWPCLSLVTGVAAATAVEQVVPGVMVKLKWPNDLYIASSKLAGILVEAIPRGSSASSPCVFIIGIGLNVAVDFRDAPTEVQQRACSLSQFARQAVDLPGTLVHLIEQLQRELAAWHSHQSSWWQAWSERNLLSERTVQARLSTGQIVSGRCEGIDQQGCLVLRHAGGAYHLQSAEIVHWE